MVNKMKRLLILPAALTILLLFLASCGKEYIQPQNFDEDYWLRQERGVVVYNDFSCDYYIVETNRGNNVIRNYSGLVPYTGDVLYGDFSSWGTRSIYNRSSGYLIRGDVRDYWLSWFRARDIVAYQCGR
jgi:hypothetical protein